MNSPSLTDRLAATLRAEWRAHRWHYIAWLVWFAAFALLVRSTLGGPDGTRYLSYLRSLVFDRDLMLSNELERFGQRVIITSTGYSAQIANVGIIPYWLPFYLMGVVSAWLNGDVGSGLASNYQLWLDFGDWLYGLLAMLVMAVWLRKRAPAGPVMAPVLLAALGSSYVYYMVALAPSYHMTTVLLCALFFALWDRTRGRRTLAQWLALGLLAGTAMSIAQYHALLVVFPALEAVAVAVAHARAWLRAAPRTAVGLLRPLWPLAAGGAAAAGGLVLPLVPQLVTWNIVFGNPFANPYTIDANWSATHFADVLFSSYHGLFFTAPVLAIAVAGWLLGLRRDPVLFGGALLLLAGITYSSATRIGFWGGVSFGMRYAIGLTPLFALGLATVLSAVPLRVRNGVIALGVLCALWTYGYFLQAFGGLTSFSEYHPAEQWIANQKIILRDLGSALAVHWRIPRSSALLGNLAGFAVISLVIWRAGIGLLAGSQRRAGVAALVLAAVPVLFAVGLQATVPNNVARMAALQAEGYYAKNSNRGEFDWEQFSNEYVERARYYDAVGQRALAQRDIARAFELWPNPARAVLPGAAPDDALPLGIKFSDDLQLLAYTVEPPVITAGRPLTVTFYWDAARRLPVDYDTAALLIDGGGQVAMRSASGRGPEPFPASWWLPGTVVADRHIIDTTGALPATLYRLRAELFDPAANKRLITPGNGLIGEVKRPPLPATVGAPLGTLGGAATLAAVQMTRTAGGVALHVTWRADAALGRDYTVFVHLLDAQNAIVAQQDAQPLKGRYPTHAWSPGDVITETYDFALPSAQQERVQSALIGLYNLADGKRLPAASGGDALRIPLR